MSNDENAVELHGVGFSYDAGRTWALSDIDLTIPRGQRVCLVGPNGSGKSTLARVVSGLSAPDHGLVSLLGMAVRDGTGIHPDLYRRARRSIGAVFQNPEDQIVTTVVADDIAFGPENLATPPSAIGGRIDMALSGVGLRGHESSDPTRMSGGQQQRVAIAGTLAMTPDMIVFDEPTAMLDVKARSSVLGILDSLQRRGVTIIHVTHHLYEAARADRLIRVDHGIIVSDAMINGSRPAPPLLGESLRMDTDTSMQIPGHVREHDDPPRTNDDCPPVIQAHDVGLRYADTGRVVLRNVSFDVHAGERVAITGPNGSGKTTLARLICGFGTAPTSGSLTVVGHDMAKRRDRRSRSLRRSVGYVMQHPERQLFADTVREDVGYGPRNQGLPRETVDARVDEALALMGVSGLADRSPFALSGGQQRLVAIAGIIACHPTVVVMDEPEAGLDQQALKRMDILLDRLSKQGVAVVLITHDDRQIAGASHVVSLPVHEPSLPENPPVHQHDVVRSYDMDDSHDWDISDNDAGTSAPSPHRSGSGVLARVDPRVKLLGSLALMFTAFTVSTPAQLALTAVLTTFLAIASGVPPRRLGRSVRVLLVLFIITGLLNVLVVRTGTPLLSFGPILITDEGLVTAVLYSCRFAMVVVIGALVLLTTPPTRITDAVDSMLSPLNRWGLHADVLALVLSLALRFLPTLGTETRSIIDAQAARGGDVGSGSPARRVRALVAVTIPVFAATLRHADNLSLALDARCYEAGAKRTHWRTMRITTLDRVAVTICVAYIAALFTVGMVL
ncbi:energy-coupling factor transporter ATPase [uncultured Bifidobacterium sp.]|uniref:energy-coupling factor transporter ATPase n=1 Tax=uncultured Bifidobacterium sp. TaxID=165187 RepID=UPI00261B82F7|nr:energy-coupling factor transporter ATPase [uncultured Bifidobacterium sp.]